jgi:hypothetical protein
MVPICFSVSPILPGSRRVHPWRGQDHALFLKRQLSLLVSTMPQWRVMRSSMAVVSFEPEEKATAKAVLQGLVLQHQVRRWAKASEAVSALADRRRSAATSQGPPQRSALSRASVGTYYQL